jgi:hypothetical protein
LDAQFDHQSVYPELEGDPLLTVLVEDFKPATVLTYGQARDTLFAKIDARNDSLIGVYSGHKLYLDPNEDPTTYVYLDGIDDGINTEHTYPRSKGAENGNARSDLHHLYPTRIRVNSDRGNLPFGEIPDQETTKWYYLNGTQSSIPGANIDLFSEGTADFFEPREGHKGNVARSIFYFYTMYRDQADAADPDFFELQKETLCNWHYLDPVDSVEWFRNLAIANYQDGKPNPFILDCTLAGRTYCDMIDQACAVVGTSNTKSIATAIHVFPNPAQDIVRLRLDGFDSGLVQLKLYRFDGKLIFSKDEIINTDHENDFNINIKDYNTGIYILNIISISNGQARSYSTRLKIE